MAFSSKALRDLHLLSTRKSFQDVIELAENLKQQYGPIIFGDNQPVVFSKAKVDKTAENLLPPHYSQENAKPILTKGDGNCLFNAASLAICGSEKLSTDLRVHTAIELATHFSFYQNHPTIVNCGLKRKNGKPWDVHAIYYAVVFGVAASTTYSTNCFEAAFQQEIMNTMGYGNFSGLLQVMGLASVVGREIHLIYPDTRHIMLGLLNGVYPPRELPKDGIRRSIVIMWSCLSGWPDRVKLFKVDHFVPILPVQTSNVWNVVTKKRKRNLLQKTTSKTSSPPKLVDLTSDNDDHLRSETKRKPESEDTTMPKKKRNKYKQSKTRQNDNGNAELSSWQPTMPFLGQSWFEERSMKVKHVAQSETHLSKDGDGQAKELLITMPLLSETFYGSVNSATKHPADNDVHLSKDGDGQAKKLFITMPLLSEAFYGSVSLTEHPADNYDVTSNENQIIYDSEKLSCSQQKPRNPLEARSRSSNNYEIRLPLMSQIWYTRRGRLAAKNNSRLVQNQETTRIVANKETIAIRKGDKDGGIEENIKLLNKKIDEENSQCKRAELHAVAEVAKFIMECGPLVSTQQAGDIYKIAKKNFLGETKTTVAEKRLASSCLFGRFSRHLNIQQVYIHGKAYIVERSSRNVEQLVERLNAIIPKDKIINNQLENNLANMFKDSLRFMDTKRDRDVLKGIFAKATSIRFTTKLQGIQNRNAITNCRDELEGKLDEFCNIEKTSMIVSNAMTNEQQHLFARRIVQKRKEKEFKSMYDSRGRMLKCEQWPDLAKTIEYIFNNQDVTERAGGGLEAHPRLKEDILYRSKDNNTFMRQAHDIVNTISPPSFNISLSSCYNYTMTYKKNSAAAKRHHHGMNVNAKLSLHQPPHTKVDRLVVNLHYSSANVNYICDYANKHTENILIDSKDAKKIVCANITPVQKPAKVWTNIEYPDHDWDQSRNNAATPMTHLFLRTDITYRENSITRNPAIDDVDIHLPFSSTILHVTRTGKAVTLINPSLLEPETTFRLFHETLLLLSKPSLDKFFRNPKTGCLKGEFVFIVDNGPAEDPSSPLVQMLMVRLLKLLNLDRVTQASFAEYHSKRNFVERVHAVEDQLLARHGTFPSHGVHKDTNILPGSEKHVENMENMCEMVANCLRQGRFDGRPLEVFRGVKNDSFLFNDEKQLKTFLSHNEAMKESCASTYHINKKSPLIDDLVAVWNISLNFQGNYLEDHQMLNNCLPNVAVRTAWRDKYTTAVYRVDDEWKERSLARARQEFQPIPDYLRWIQTKGELHYLPLEQLQLVSGKWNETPGLFRPERLLDILFTMNSHPLDDMYKYFAILVWLPEHSVLEYFQDKQKNLSDDLQEDLLREKWRQHPLYTKKVEMLRTLCKRDGLPFQGQKHHLVQQLAEREKVPIIPDDYTPDYHGDLTTLAKTVSEIRKYPVARIRFILNYHGLPTTGTKEEIILRLLLVCHHRYYLCFKHQEEELLTTISQAEDIILEEKRHYVVNSEYTYRKRTHSTMKFSSYLNTPGDTNFHNLHNIFKPLKEYISILKDLRIQKDKELCNKNKDLSDDTIQNDDYEVYEEFFAIGKKVKIKWTKDEIGDSGWRAGWYCAQVQEGQIENDNVCIVYLSEPGNVYTICVSEYLALGKLKLA